MRILFQVIALVYCATNSFEMTSLADELQAKSSLNTTNPAFETKNENLDESSPFKTTKMKIDTVKLKELLTLQLERFTLLILASDIYLSMIPREVFKNFTVDYQVDIVENWSEDGLKEDEKEDENGEANYTEEQETDKDSRKTMYYFKNLTAHLQYIGDVLEVLLNSIECLEDKKPNEAKFKKNFTKHKYLLFELLKRVSLTKITEKIAYYMPEKFPKEKYIIFQEYQKKIVTRLTEFISNNQKIVEELGE